MYEAFKSNLWILKPTIIYLFFNFFFQDILPQACIFFVFLQKGDWFNQKCYLQDWKFLIPFFKIAKILINVNAGAFDLI